MDDLRAAMMDPGAANDERTRAHVPDRIAANAVAGDNADDDATAAQAAAAREDAEAAHPPLAAVTALHLAEQRPADALPQALSLQGGALAACGATLLPLTAVLLPATAVAPPPAAAAPALGGRRRPSKAPLLLSRSSGSGSSGGTSAPDGTFDASSPSPSPSPTDGDAEAVSAAAAADDDGCPIADVLLLSGSTRGAVAEACPPGYKLVGDNLASVAAAMALAEAQPAAAAGGGGGGGGGGDEAPQVRDDGRDLVDDASGVDAAARSSIGGGTPPAATPACAVFLAVKRAPRDRAAAPAADAADGTVPADATADDGLAVPAPQQPRLCVRDAALFAVSAMATAPGSPPQLVAPRGYTLQTADVPVAVEGSGGGGVTVRLSLLTSTDAVEAAHASGGAVGLATAPPVVPASAVVGATSSVCDSDGEEAAGVRAAADDDEGGSRDFNRRKAGADGDGDGYGAPGELEAIAGSSSSVYGSGDSTAAGASADASAADAVDARRAQLIELLTAARARHAELLRANTTLHRHLAILLSIRAADGSGGSSGAAGDDGKPPGADGDAKLMPVPAIAGSSGGGVSAAFAAADKERRYEGTLTAVAAERAAWAAERASFDGSAMKLQAQLDGKEARVAAIAGAFEAFRRDVAAEAVDSRSGAGIPREAVDRYEAADRDRTGALCRLQLRVIHLETQLSRLESQLASRQQLADGLALVDFEQLRIENAVLAEKVDERVEALAGLRKKAGGCVQVLTHLREKAHHVEGEVGGLRRELAGVNAAVAAQQAALADAKREREGLRCENTRLQQAQSFAHDDALAVDFERRKRAVAALQDRVGQLQARHAALGAAVAAAATVAAPVAAGSGATAPMMTTARTAIKSGATRLPR